MKEYKIEIPETDVVSWEFADKYCPELIPKWGRGLSAKKITRAEIHELVQAKAFRLGYLWKNGKIAQNLSVKHLYLYSQPKYSSNVQTMEHGLSSAYFKDHGNEQIAWQDFLELPELSKYALPPYDEKKNCALCAENTVTKTGLCLGCDKKHKEALGLIELGAKTKAANKITKEDCIRILELFQPEFEQPVISRGKGSSPEFVEKRKLYDNAVKQLNKYFEEPAK